MNTNKEQRPFKTAFCATYEEMLVECQKALETWARRREEAWQLGLRGKELGGELVRLQADFAKSYSRLQKHTRECSLCAFVAKISNENHQVPYVVTADNSRPA
jgi:aspartyl/asparaginyl beta-hydroxylase (cupin superfamily)